MRTQKDRDWLLLPVNESLSKKALKIPVVAKWISRIRTEVLCFQKKNLAKPVLTKS